MELRHYLTLLRRKKLLVVLTALAGILGGYLVTPRTSSYRAAATIYVGTKSLALNSDNLGNTSQGLQQIAFTFAAMVPSRPIASKALAITHLPIATERVVAETTSAVIPGTNLVKVSVTDRSPVAAQALTNGIAEGLVEEIVSFEPPSSGAGQPAYVFEEATLPVAPLPIGGSRNLILGGLLGFVLSIAVVLLVDYLDVTLKTPEELERRVELPVLGTVPLQNHPIPTIATRLGRRQPEFAGGPDG